MSKRHAPKSGPVADQPSVQRPAGEPERNERDARGRFLPGNGGGPGNPFGRRVAALRKMMLEEFSDEDARKLARKMIGMALEGDMAAARVYTQIAMGRAAPAGDPDRVEVDEWRLSKESAVAIQAWQALMHHLPADLVNELTSIVWPCFVAKFGKFFQEGSDERRASATTKAADEPGETVPADEGPRSTTTPTERQTKPSTNGGNGKRHRAPVGARAHGAAEHQQASSPIGRQDKLGAPSTKGRNGRLGCDVDPEGDCIALDPKDDNGRHSFANLLAGLPPEALEAIARG